MAGFFMGGTASVPSHLVADLGASSVERLRRELLSRTTSCLLRLCGESVPLRELNRLHARFPCAVSNPATPANPPGQVPP